MTDRVTDHPVTRPSGHLRVTALGSYSGTQMSSAIAMVFDELSDLPHLPELPERGVPAQMIGRGGAFLAGLTLGLEPSGWRLADTPDAAARRARSLLRQDLDDLEEQIQGYQGPVTLSVAGPWTLSASIQLRRGAPVLSDHGARRELAASLNAGIADLVGELAGRLPGVNWHLQVDEPSLVAVQRGRVATSSGFGRLRSVSESELAATLRAATHSCPGATVHVCAPGITPALALRAQAGSISLDATHLSPEASDEWGEWVSGGGSLMLGVLDASAPQPATADQIAAIAGRVIRNWGLAPDVIRNRIWLTPSCGLASWSTAQAIAGLKALRGAAAQVDDLVER